MNDMLYISDLSQVDLHDIDKVGGKAANLGVLIRHEFPVPSGFVLTTKAYSQFIKENKLQERISPLLKDADFEDTKSIDSCSLQIQEAMTKAQLPPEIKRQITEAYGSLGNQRVAIRSSATAEDLPTASFAGQQDTYLNVIGVSNVIKAVQNCYSSLWTARAIAYRHSNEVVQEDVRLAVIMQEMVPAERAGVMFTANPISLSRSEILIESCFGLGESIVSGSITPDQYTVSMSKGNGDQTSPLLTVIGRELGQKETQIKQSDDAAEDNGGGLETTNSSDSRAMEHSLEESEILELAKMGLDIQDAFEFPQDIEWAIDDKGRIQILQSRQITSLISLPSKDDLLWTRGYSDDYWNDPVSPLFFELLGDYLSLVVNNELNSVMGYPKMDKRLLRLSQGHVYFNLDVLRRKVEYEIPTFLRNDDVLNYFPKGTEFHGKETVQKLPFKLKKRIAAELRVMIHDPDGAISNTARAYETWTSTEFNVFCDGFDDTLAKIADAGTMSQLLELADDLNHVMLTHFRLVRYGIPVHNIGMNLMAQYLLGRFLGADTATRMYPHLISGLVHKTSETNDRIHQLAASVRKDPELRAFLLDGVSETLYASLQSSEFDAFLSKFDAFLSEFGDRGFTREPYYPRWREAPHYIFDILKSLVMDTEQDLQAIAAASEKKRRMVEKHVQHQIRSQRFGLLKWKLCLAIIELARQYIVFRESQRFNLDHWISRNRQVYLSIGHRLANQGVIEHGNDIFFLRKREIRSLSAREFTPRETRKIVFLVKKRKNEFLKYEHTTPPKFMHGSRSFDDPQSSETGHQVFFRGIAASSGVISGRIRVLSDIKDIATVRSGDIIVVPRTDPGWTSVFAKIGGLITETGGILSHGAVVSREYGIPAVTNVRNARQILRTGPKGSGDGNAGTVRMENT